MFLCLFCRVSLWSKQAKYLGRFTKFFLKISHGIPEGITWRNHKDEYGCVYIIYYMNYNTHMQPMLLVYLPTWLGHFVRVIFQHRGAYGIYVSFCRCLSQYAGVTPPRHFEAKTHGFHVIFYQFMSLQYYIVNPCKSIAFAGKSWVCYE